MVAIGDLHGDVDATRAALRTAGAIDAQDHWSGGSLVVVQTGDQLDRGDQERAILELLERLAEEARRAGGALYALNGNHEVMNAQGDFRYVTPGGYHDFEGSDPSAMARLASAGIPTQARGRVAAFMPGGRWARVLASHNTVMVVGDTAFVHGGLLAEHADFGLDAINNAVRAFFLGERETLPPVLEGEQSPLWLRTYALRDDAESCALLGRALERASVRRLVVGHTVQQRGINSACEGRVWRIDVGLARYYNGPVEVLELTPNAEPRVLRGTR